MSISVNTPLTREDAKKLKAGDSCLISGVIYTARDAAHKRLCELIAQGEKLPLDIKDSIIYFVGPTPAKPGQAIGRDRDQAGHLRILRLHGAGDQGCLHPCQKGRLYRLRGVFRLWEIHPCQAARRASFAPVRRDML